MDIGARIRHKRNELDMTLETLSEKVGLCKQTVSRYERGIIKNIPSDKIAQIAECLNTTPAYLMGWDDTTKDDELNKRIIEIFSALPDDKKAQALDYAVYLSKEDK